jgi:DNA-3-methyladenine glycosylase II
MESFTGESLRPLCDKLAKKDARLKNIIAQYGYPPFWSRPATFASLILIILEQQVSLASAKAAFGKLQAAIGTVTPQKLLRLSDAELKACYFSRQKTVYARCLATAILNKQVVLKQLASAPNDAVRSALTQVKGIGNWTVDVYLMMVLQRCDLFPGGDIALINSAKEVLQLPPQTGRDAILAIAEKWAPYRTIAAFLLWHAYLCKRKKQPVPPTPKRLPGV